MGNIRKLMNQICSPHLVYHYKILPHWVTLGIAVVLLLLALAWGWSVLEDNEQKNLGLKTGLFVAGTLMALIVYILVFWNIKTKTWYDATVNSPSTFTQTKQAVSREYPFCVVIKERDDIDKPIYFIFCKDAVTVNHINKQISQLEYKGTPVAFLNSNSNMVVVHTTKFEKIETVYELPSYMGKKQLKAHLPQSYSIINQPIVFQDSGVDSNTVNTNQLNSNLIKLFNVSN